MKVSRYKSLVDELYKRGFDVGYNGCRTSFSTDKWKWIAKETEETPLMLCRRLGKSSRHGVSTVSYVLEKAVSLGLVW
jgi:hypothetical protein